MTPKAPRPSCPACGVPAPTGACSCPSCGADFAAVSQTPTRSDGRDHPPPAAACRPSALAHRSAPSSGPGGSGGWAPGTILAARYRVVAMLGRGGMGVVYRADDLKLGQPVALKFLPPTVVDDQERLQGLYAEVRTTRLVSHPNVCRVFDVAELDGRPFLAMEYIDGEDLASLLKRIGRLPRLKAVELAQQLCAGLAAAHDRGIVHRDLKPANVMIDGRGQARITDFGLALAAGHDTRAGEIAGTPLYMAPEQLAGERPDERSDLYALGLILYEIVTGERPFAGATVAELLRARSGTAPRPSRHAPELEPAVERAILACLEPDPAARPASALHLAALLPGRDALAAALAAGRTPSPETVAAAGARGGLGLAAGWALLGAFAGGLVVCVALASRTTTLGAVAPAKSPEALAENARATVAAAGLDPAPADSTWWLETDRAQVERWIATRSQPEPSGAVARAAMIRFVYRQSPEPLVSFNPLWSLSRNNPPFDQPGMVTVELDAAGRLRSLRALPGPSDAGGARTPAQWQPLFDRAGLDPSDFAAVEPLTVPLAPFDELVAWRSTASGLEEAALDVTAAWFRGAPVLFEVTPARADGPTTPTAGTGRRRAVAGHLWAAMTLVFFAAGGYFAQRNLRLGRGDGRGAWRLALLAIVLRLVSTSLTVHPAFGSGMRFFGWFRTTVGSALLSGLVAWLLYLALEPYARRSWPQLLVGWSRTLSGRARDPLVARDLLVGATLGVWAVLAGQGLLLAAGLLPDGSAHLTDTRLDALLGFRHLLASTSGSLMFYLAGVIVVTTGLAVGSAVLRHRAWGIAIAAIVPLATTLKDAASWQPVGLALAGAVIAVVFYLATLVRYGMLACLAMSLVSGVLANQPIVVRAGAWYSASALVTLALVSAVAVYGFVHSLGGRSPLAAIARD